MKILSDDEMKSKAGGMRWQNNRQSDNVRDHRNIRNETRWGREGREDSPNDRSGSRSNGSRVICTHFFKKGMLDQKIWRADMEFTFKNLSPTTVRGYHVWAIPYVKLMRKSSLAERIIFPLAVWRAEELAFKMGVRESGNWRGKFVRAIGEPLCWTIGVFVKEQNWEALWQQSKSVQLVEDTSAT